MYRFTTLLSQSHLVLVRKKLSDGSCAALVVMRAPVRQYAKDHFAEKCPEPTPIKKSRKLLFGMIGATLMTGAAVVYAKNSRPARNWLETNAPWADEFVSLVYQEKTTYGQFTIDQLTKTKNKIVDFLFGKEGITPIEAPSQAEQDLKKDAEIGFAPKTYPLPPPALEPLYVEVKPPPQAEVEVQATLVQTEKCEPNEPPKVEITKEVLSLEQDMHKYTRIAVDNYKKGRAILKDYNTALTRVIESPPGDANLFTALKGLRAERDTLQRDAAAAAARARCALEKLERMIKNQSIAAPPENLARTHRFINQFRRDMDEAEEAYKAELVKGEITDKYWNKIEDARRLFQVELQTLFPDVDLCARKLDLRGDIDLFILYCVNQVQFLQNSIAELQTTFEHKLNKAIECKEESALIEAKAQEMFRKEKQIMELQYQKKALQVMAEAHRKMKEELHKQYEQHENLTQQRLKKSEMELMAKANRQASEQIEQERIKFKKELAVMAGKLQAIEQTLKQRSAAEAEAKRSQSIWAAGEALLAATRRRDPVTRVSDELKALEKAGEKDKLVQTVMKGISKETLENGIATEKALRERFDVLERTAAKVALIGRSGATLPVYFLSWLQSKLLFQQYADIPQNELDNLPTDFSQLDTFDIIHRARYHMDHGDLGAALRYVNLLQGAPRAAAACWLREARTHLEVKQAAETVMAHASLSGMLYS